MFLFTHIEKCAGTSFNEILSLTFPMYIHITKNKYGGNELRNDLKNEEFNKLMNYFPSGLGGHSVRPYLDFLDKKSNQKITFLRNPIERYMSHYNHLYETGWAVSVDDFLSKKHQYDFMTVKIAGANDYNKAEKLLLDFNFIGDANTYNKSINHLQDVLNVKFIGKEGHKNQRKKKSNYVKYEDLSKAQKLRAEANNRNDIKLYEKFISNSTVLNSYSNEIQLRPPSKLRLKCISKLNDFKKKKIVEPIRLK